MASARIVFDGRLAGVESVTPVVGSKTSFGLSPGASPRRLDRLGGVEVEVRGCPSLALAASGFRSSAPSPKPKKLMTPICSRLPASLAR